MSSAPPVDVLIVGAGIVGAACAEACAEAGLSTMVVAAAVGDGATAAGMGHLVVMDDSPAQLALTGSGVALWRQRAWRLPGVEFDRCGTLWLATDERHMALAQRRCAAYRAEGVRAELVGPALLRELEPRLADDLVGALLVPDDAMIYPPVAARGLLAQALARGARLKRAAVIAATAAEVVLEGGWRLPARTVVVAAGTASAALVPGLALRPRKGHLVITDRYPGWARHQLVELGYLASAHGGEDDTVAFNVQPRRGGQLLIGSSRQYGHADAAVDHRVIARMVGAAERFLPGISGLNAIRCWTGLRPATPDHLPLIGRAGDGPWLATGHEGLGITTALATARLLVELLHGHRPHLDPAPYDPGRFSRMVAHA